MNFSYIKEITALFSEKCHEIGSKKNIYVDPITGETTFSWRINGGANRSNGPAYLKFDCAGRLLSEAWFNGGGLHRVDGPAITNYDPITGKIIETQWWENSRRLSKWEEQAAPYLNN